MEPSALLLLLTIAHTITVAGGIEKRRKETKKNMYVTLKQKKNKAKQAGEVSMCAHR